MTGTWHCAKTYVFEPNPFFKSKPITCGQDGEKDLIQLRHMARQIISMIELYSIAGEGLAVLALVKNANFDVKFVHDLLMSSKKACFDFWQFHDANLSYFGLKIQPLSEEKYGKLTQKSKRRGKRGGKKRNDLCSMISAKSCTCGFQQKLKELNQQCTSNLLSAYDAIMTAHGTLINLINKYKLTYYVTYVPSIKSMEEIEVKIDDCHLKRRDIIGEKLDAELYQALCDCPRNPNMDFNNECILKFEVIPNVKNGSVKWNLLLSTNDPSLIQGKAIQNYPRLTLFSHSKSFACSRPLVLDLGSDSEIEIKSSTNINFSGNSSSDEETEVYTESDNVWRTKYWNGQDKNGSSTTKLTIEFSVGYCSEAKVDVACQTDEFDVDKCTKLDSAFPFVESFPVDVTKSTTFVPQKLVKLKNDVSSGHSSTIPLCGSGNDKIVFEKDKIEESLEMCLFCTQVFHLLGKICEAKEKPKGCSNCNTLCSKEKM